MRPAHPRLRWPETSTAQCGISSRMATTASPARRRARALLTRTRELGWLGADSSGAWGARPWASRSAPPTRAQLAWAPPIIRASCSASGAALSTFQQHFYVRLRGRSGGALGSAAASTSGLRSSPRWLDGVPRPRGQQLAKRGGSASALASKSHIGRCVSYFFNLPKLVLYLELGVSKYVATHRPPRQPLGK